MIVPLFYSTFPQQFQNTNITTINTVNKINLKSIFKFFFSPASVHLEGKGQEEIIILLFCLCSLDRQLGDWHGKNSTGLLSIKPYLDYSLHEQQSVLAFHCPILITRNCTGDNMCNKRQFNKRKGNKYINMYILCVLVRKARMSKSKSGWNLELTDYLYQRTVNI